MSNAQQPKLSLSGRSCWWVHKGGGLTEKQIWKIFFYCCSSTVVLIFPPPISTPPISSTPPTPTSHPQSYPTLALSMGLFYMLLDDPSPSFLHYPLPPPLQLQSVCSLFQYLWLYFVCLFILSIVCFVTYKAPLIGEVIRYLSFTTWLILLIIMLSNSIHDVMKGRSSFFLSAEYHSTV